MTLLASPPSGLGEPSGHPPRPDLQRAKLAQRGAKLVLALRTSAPVPLAKLVRRPRVRRPGARYLCLALRRVDRRSVRRLCLGGVRRGRELLGLQLVDAAGRTMRQSIVPARVKRPDPQRLALALDPADAGLKPHRYRWRVLEGRAGCATATACREALPARGSRSFQLRPVRLVGCTGGRAAKVRHGPRDRRLLALTFDDGPGSWTADFLDVLRRKRVHATFFVIGQEVPGREEVLRRALREGHEIGNHSMHHEQLPDLGALEATSALIRAATRFRPCLFRPPGGVVNASLVSAAGAAGMATVLWDVDPADWTRPGAGAIHDRVVGAARPGSIVVLHDGGGDRSETLAALPRIVDTLRGRGYRLVTVSRLLGHRPLYRPYG